MVYQNAPTPQPAQLYPTHSPLDLDSTLLLRDIALVGEFVFDQEGLDDLRQQYGLVERQVWRVMRRLERHGCIRVTLREGEISACLAGEH